MSAQHTPGPWVAKVTVDRLQSGEYLSVMAGTVCIVGGCGCCGSPFMDGPAEANARVIAAAPELFDAIKSIETTAARALAATTGDLSRDLVQTVLDVAAAARLKVQP